MEDRMGRPRMDSNGARARERVGFALTAAQRKRLKAEAAKAGLSLSAYIRKMLRLE